MASTDRDNNGRLVSMEKQDSSNDIRGPLGIWPFPILNLIMSRTTQRKERRVVITELRRDDDGRITAMEEFEL